MFFDVYISGATASVWPKFIVFFFLITRNTTLENPVFQDVPGKADERTS